MFDIGSSELLMIAVVAIVVIGPKDLPRALYKLGQIVGKARSMSRHFRSGIDVMMREVEMEEMEKKWAEQNRRIMEEHPEAFTPEAAPEAVDAGSAAVAAAQRSLFDDALIGEAAGSSPDVTKPTPPEGSAA